VEGRPTAGGVSSTPGKPTRQQLQFFAKIKANGQKQLDLYRSRANTALRTQRSQSLASLETKSGIALGIMALLSILLGWLVAGRALRPLRTMNQRAREITEESLHQRVGVEPRTDELGELAATFDALLERLERAFDAQRRFVANASHELRTPLTLERALVEVALADPDASVQSLRRCCQRVLVSSAQQERVIDALLTLARGQAGIEYREQVDLADLAAELLAARAFDTAGLSVEAKLEPAIVDGDRALLERMVANLIDNAIAHNLAEHGWIRVQTAIEAGKPVLRVANSGQVVPPDRLDELFEPFRRLDGERIGQDRGLGLGLSIVRAIALAHGAELAAEAPVQGGLEIELAFAAARSDPAGPAAPAAAVDRHQAGRVAASL
jgi:signal transduction histidine kinase